MSTHMQEPTGSGKGRPQCPGNRPRARGLGAVFMSGAARRGVGGGGVGPSPAKHLGRCRRGLRSTVRARGSAPFLEEGAGGTSASHSCPPPGGWGQAHRSPEGDPSRAHRPPPKSLVSLPCDARSPQLPPAIGAQQAPDAPEFSDVKLSPDWTKEKGAWSAPFG